ncbi:hypothetical protein BRC84_02240 [Halobacteriales archaeon QS_1_68_44]|nr:MAG: hypothetical protein BRC84_02240 [Halobacteriales archaeon QS_1_68_44]
MSLRNGFGLSRAWQLRLTRGLQVAMVGLFAVGLVTRNAGVVVNAAAAFGVSLLPATLERDYNIPLNAGLTLWITTAVFLHALGAVVVPVAGVNIYSFVPWWDHLTHTLSSSIVAAVGYTTARAFDEHSKMVRLPPQFTFAFILVVTLAFGVFWEVVEFAIGEIAALTGGAVLTQYGLRDTMLDLVFDTVGAVVVAVWGTAHLTDVVGAVTERLDERRTDSGR